MLFSTLKLPLDGLSDEIGALLAIVQYGVHAVQRALWQAGRDLLMVDLFSAHALRIDDITNCYKPYFTRYHLFTSPLLMISSIHQQRETDMTKQFPTFAAHNQVSCFNCEGDLDGAHFSDSGNAEGRWVQHCEKCRMSTWYDLKVKEAA
jgi:hypothetical protein